jgi:CheY-like chemotaxis protein
LQRPKILYVDDHDLVLFTVKQLLESEGWIVDACRDSAAALKKIAGDAHYDLLIFDEHLPGVSGLELATRARGSMHLRPVPIVMFTAAPCEDEARERGVNAFLRKPGQLGELVATCRELLQTKPLLGVSAEAG